MGSKWAMAGMVKRQLGLWLQLAGQGDEAFH